MSAPIRTLVFLVFAILALTFVDRVLATAERADSRVDAARFFSEGQQFLRQRQPADAVDRFRSAMSEERGNRIYQLALGEAQLAAGKPADAEATLNALLEKNSAWADANLAMARVLIQEGRIEDGIVFYHRAIYGQWDSDARAHQVQVRFELADLLSRQGSAEALLSELLPLENDAPDDPATKKRLGSLFIAAGSPARAAAIFRDLLKAHPDDAELYANVGEAEFARGNYRTAQAQFQAALALNPVDHGAKDRLQLIGQVLDLDPARRGMSTDEQYARSRRILEFVMNDVAACLGANASPAAQELIAAAGAGLKQQTSRKSGQIEENLSWADRLWQFRKNDCKQPVSPEEEPYALVLAIPAR